MRVAITAAAGLIAAALSCGPALAGGDKFSICEDRGAASRSTAAKDIFAHWPDLRPADIARRADVPDAVARRFFKDVSTYHLHPAPSSLGLVYELFKKSTPIGNDGYRADLAGQPNMVLNDALLDNWATASDPITIKCGKDSPDGRRAQGTKPSWYFLLRDNGSHIEQALGNKLDKDAFPSPTNSSASIAFHHDQLDRSNNTFTMHAALGYGGNIRPGLEDQIGLVGYISADRINNAANAHPGQNATDFAAGIGLALFHAGDKTGARVNTYVQADTDGRFGASLIYVGAQASLWPLDDFCVANPMHLSPFLALKCGWNADLDYEHVFNKGDFKDLTSLEFSRFGGDVSGTLSLSELPDDYVEVQGDLIALAYRFLDALSVGASYKALHDLSGDGANLSRFEASLSYKIGGDESNGGLGKAATIALTFTNGRADRTLQAERFWELQLKTSL